MSDLMLTPEQMMEMFVGEWEQLATLAYSQFLKSGRGAIYIDMSMFQVEGGMMMPQTVYVPENNLKWLADLINAKTKNLLKTYDPEKMIVLLIKVLDNSVKTMYIGTNEQLASPKQLFDEQQKRPIH